ncbi:exodeoxyribonuclease V subunit alpha [Thalassotalea sediminis]|uniref:exodeoxyribonuclease V subunit alpha n=1 Tax=Thalassotalea sediminis TaxID=1759089 RepID=UPI0025734494|nr:exodeoxyribonuclease V subunit alpha [Thalassotalea sediminis]
MLHEAKLENVDVKLPYSSIQHAKTQLYGIESIDYYTASQLTPLLISRCKAKERLTIEAVSQLFHLVIALSQALRNGHTCLPLLQVAGQCLFRSADNQGVILHQGYLFPNTSTLQALLSSLDRIETTTLPIVYSKQALFLRRYYCFEQSVLNYLENSSKMESSLLSTDHSEIKQTLDTLFPCGDVNVAKLPDIDWQKVAVANALNKPFSIIAGGPGTGKTYTVTKLLAAILMLSNQSELTITLTAPTGKAAQRLSESIVSAVASFQGDISPEVLKNIPSKAQTLHRLLGVIPHSPNFKHDEQNPLAIDVLLIDEVSMVDLPMMSRVLRALPQTCRVIMLGDAQQLPSVAAGSLLTDLAPLFSASYSQQNVDYLSSVTGFSSLPKHKTTFIDHVTYLTYSRRFAGDGGIGQLAKAVIAGQSEQSWRFIQQQDIQQSSELSYFTHEQIAILYKQAVDYYAQVAQCCSIEEAFKALSQFRILTAMRVGPLGVNEINQTIDERIRNTLPQQQAFAEHYHGKPIMITTNDYGLGLYNGDIGIMWPNSNGQLVAFFEAEAGEFKQFIPSRLPTYEAVYAMTIHKTQGSEFTNVVLVLPEVADNQLLSRELIYTGITRAKKHLSLVANQEGWFAAVDAKVTRFSGITLVD